MRNGPLRKRNYQIQYLLLMIKDVYIGHLWRRIALYIGQHDWNAERLSKHFTFIEQFAQVSELLFNATVTTIRAG